VKSNNYNFIAPIYDLLTCLIFFGSIQRAQKKYLNLLPETGRVLFIGGGTGTTLRKLVQLKPHLNIDYVDSSPKMIALSKKKLHKLKSKQVNFICSDESAIPVCQYDGILSFFYFDLFPFKEGEKIFNQLLSQLKMNGVWLIADFYQAKNWPQKALGLLMYQFLKLTTNIKSNKIPAISSLTQHHQLQHIKSSAFYNQFIFSKAFSKSSWNNN